MYSPSKGTDDVGEALLLTPFIEAGNLSEARNLSRVAPLLDNIESYAGYFTVDQTAKSHLHFWFIPKTVKDNTTAPLVIWLQNGGTLISIFAENGPFVVSEEGLRRRELAWTNHYHMLYIDTLMGCGYSFTEAEYGYYGSDIDVGKHVHIALLQFYKLFYEFQSHDLYLAGNAGTYIPAIGHQIHIGNRQPDYFKIPLKGIMIGNGISDIENKGMYVTYLYNIGLIDRQEREKLEKSEKKMRYLIRSGNWLEAAYEDEIYNKNIGEMIGDLSYYDYTGDVSDLTRLLKRYTDFMKQDEVRKRIHAGRVEFDASPPALIDALRRNYGQPIRRLIEELLEHYPILFYNGLFDLSSSHLLNKNFLSHLQWSGALEFYETKKQIWREGNSVAGYYTATPNLTYVLIRNAGHMACHDQPENVLKMINKFIENKFFNSSTPALNKLSK